MSVASQDLPEGYYLSNFLYLLDFVEARYRDLLLPVELDFLSKFRGVSVQAQRLYVRLALRKGPLFRRDKLGYPEISDIGGAAAELTSRGLMANGQSASLDLLAGLLVKSELATLLGLRQSLKREQLEQALFDEYASQPLLDVLPFQIYQPLGTDTVKTFRMLFFGNLRQDFTDFVLSDLGVMRYETYVVDRQSRLFNSREAIEQMLYLYELIDFVRDTDTLSDYQSTLQLATAIPVVLAPEVEARAHRLINSVARQLERFGDSDTAKDLYQRSMTGQARERLARIYGQTNSGTEAALSICREIIDQPESESEAEFAIHYTQRMCHKHKIKPPVWVPEPDKFSIDFVDLPLYKEDGERVEVAVLKHYERTGVQSFYVENTLFNSVFGLAFWDIIFSDQTGVFLHPFQLGPKDMFSGSFYKKRKQQIKDRLNELTDHENFKSVVFSSYAEKQGIANYFTHWGAIEPGLLALAMNSIPNAHWLSVFARMLRDLKENRSGFPDLICFPAEGDYQLVEVKGPGDKLQKNQSRWLGHFQQAQIPHCVVNVSWL